MPFYALRITCPHCGSAFLLGGSRESDLTLWRRLTVTCKGCSTEIATADGVSVRLRRAPAQLAPRTAARNLEGLPSRDALVGAASGSPDGVELA